MVLGRVLRVFTVCSRSFSSILEINTYQCYNYTQRRYIVEKIRGSDIARPQAGYFARKPSKIQAKPTKYADDDDSTSEVEEVEFEPKRFGDKMDLALEHLKTKLAQIRIGPATTAIFENMNLQIQGRRLPFTKVAQVSMRDPKTIVITVLQTDASPEIMKSLKDSPLNLSFQQEKNTFTVVMPKVTKESREALVKVASRLRDETKNQIRNTRTKALNNLKNVTGPQDMIRTLEKQLQDLTERSNKRADDMFKVKETELLKS
eukprot:TRINITY_DN15463_c0_g1::TRINITY_DN15463_c0_g1_i1::g.30538::m.30538 TRINITY_DN15463_c0_g1::TRINITY_DN15463_c0_g1_i1::g.30538  ORF type:complete len:269 (+),score=8.53,sp/A4X4J5/RRF_SALTO/31.61/6e-22,RRF/PF01765.14/9.2e-37 TRINITY_DN15463_c0_g1_i1:26-808(+)